MVVELVAKGMYVSDIRAWDIPDNHDQTSWHTC